MKTLTINTNMVKETIDNINAAFNRTHKVISAADVWNIQRNKRARVQRRFAV